MSLHLPVLPRMLFSPLVYVTPPLATLMMLMSLPDLRILESVTPPSGLVVITAPS